jgi:protein phosphatase
VGQKRSGNEDSYDIWVSDAAGGHPLADTLLVVCDGMGGSNAGEVASRMAVEAVVRSFEAESGDEDATEDALRRAVETANAEIYQHSLEGEEFQGMGTTCTVAALKGERLVLAQVGDSRAYLVRGGAIEQLTDDHSLVAQLVARGQMTPEQARVDPRRNVVTRSVGVGPAVDVDTFSFAAPLQAGDTVLVCSDGLHGQVSDEELAAGASDTSLDRGCRELIRLANERGGPDNITVALARLEAAPAGEGEDGSGGARRGRGPAMAIVLLLLLLLIVVGFAAVLGVPHN